MELFSMICFVTLSRCLKFYEAAETLNLSQSSFSRQIQLLEESFGVKLFVRNRHGCALTPGGEALLPYAESIVREYEKAARLIEDYKKGSDRRLVLYSDCLTHESLSGILTRFQEEYPDIRLEIRELEGRLALLRLQDEPSTLCVVYTDNEAELDGYDHFSLFRDELVLLVSTQNRFAQDDSVRIPMLRDETFQIMYKPQTPFYNSIIKMCEEAGFSPRITPYGLWYSTAPEVIINSDVVSVVPRSVAERIYTPGLKLLELEGAPSFSIHVVRDKDSAADNAGLLYQWLYQKAAAHP